MADERKAKTPRGGGVALTALEKGRTKKRFVKMPGLSGGLKSGLLVSGGRGAGRVIDPSDESNDRKTAAMIDRALENIELTRRRMANDQIEIDRLRIETQALIAELFT